MSRVASVWCHSSAIRDCTHRHAQFLFFCLLLFHTRTAVHVSQRCTVSTYMHRSFFFLFFFLNRCRTFHVHYRSVYSLPLRGANCKSLRSINLLATSSMYCCLVVDFACPFGFVHKRLWRRFEPRSQILFISCSLFVPTFSRSAVHWVRVYVYIRPHLAQDSQEILCSCFPFLRDLPDHGLTVYLGCKTKTVLIFPAPAHTSVRGGYGRLLHSAISGEILLALNFILFFFFFF